MIKNLIDFFHINNQSSDKYCNSLSSVCSNIYDNNTNTSNVYIYENSLYIIYSMSIFLIILIIIETNCFRSRSTFPKEFFKSLFLMIFVGAFDYIFFNYFILKFKVIDASELLCKLYNSDIIC